MVRWSAEDLKEKDSSGITDNSSENFSGGLKQGYELGSLTDGLVAYFPFDGTVEDKALENDGTDNTSAGFVSGKIDEAKDFDGEDDFIVSNASTGGLDEVTMTAWVKIDGYSEFHTLFGHEQSFRLRLDGGNNSKYNLLIGTENNSWTTEILGPQPSGNWEYVSALYDGTGTKLYINGNLVASRDDVSGLTNDNNNNFIIGSVDGRNNFLNGQLDDLRIYDRALSRPEIKELYQRTSTQKISVKDRLTSGLVGHWPLNEDSGGTAYDLSGIGLDSTTVNGTGATVGLGGANARGFDSANDDEVQLDTSSLSLSAYTISFWASTENFSADGTNGDYLFDSPDNSDRVYIYDSATDYVQSSWGDGLMPISEWENNSWNLMTLVNYGEGKDVEFYYNGEKKNTLTEAGVNLSPEFISLGGYNYEHLDGKITDFRLYKRPLSKSEIEKLAEMGGL